MPPSEKAHGKRTIHVAGSRSHTRIIDAPVDPNDQPIVERMTRSRLDKMTAEEEEEWKTESVNAILGMTPRKSEQESIIKFMNKTSQAGPSDLSHEAPSPLKRRTRRSTGRRTGSRRRQWASLLPSATARTQLS